MAEGRLRWTQDSVQKEEKSPEAPTSSGDGEAHQKGLEQRNVQEGCEPCPEAPEAHLEQAQHPEQETDLAPSGRYAVDTKLSIWWGDDSVYYPGIVIDFNEINGT